MSQYFVIKTAVSARAGLTNAQKPGSYTELVIGVNFGGAGWPLYAQPPTPYATQAAAAAYLWQLTREGYLVNAAADKSVAGADKSVATATSLADHSVVCMKPREFSSPSLQRWKPVAINTNLDECALLDRKRIRCPPPPLR